MKVLLIDDHPLILSALQAVITGLSDGVFVTGVASANAARDKMAQSSDYDMVLLDLSLGDTDGFDLLVELRSTYPAVPVVVVSASERASDVIRAIDLGAMGFVPKRSSTEALTNALRVVMSGGLYVPPTMLGLDMASMRAMGAIGGMGADDSVSVLGDGVRPEAHQKVGTLEDLGLTPRQAEVLGLLLKGMPNKLVARALNVSVETVKDHVAAVLRALGVSTRTQAVLAVSQMTQGRGGTVPTKRIDAN